MGAYRQYRRGRREEAVLKVVGITLFFALFIAPGLLELRGRQAWQSLVDRYFSQRGIEEYKYEGEHGFRGKWRAKLYTCERQVDAAIYPGFRISELHIFITFSDDFNYTDTEALSDVIASIVRPFSTYGSVRSFAADGRGGIVVVLCLPIKLSSCQLREISRYLDEMLHVEGVDFLVVEWEGGIVPLGWD